MIKILGSFILLGFLLIFLTLNTSSTRLGSGFLIGQEIHVFTYYNLVKEAEIIKVKFPNEDDIAADIVFHDSTQNIAILELQESPKVKREPLVLSREGIGRRTESVFTLGYPWTNTMEDKHNLLEGSASNISELIELNLLIGPVHSGSPLFNNHNEVVGMLLFNAHAKLTIPEKQSHHVAIPKTLLDKALKAARVNIIAHEVKGLSREAFINKSKNNIVLIEAT